MGLCDNGIFPREVQLMTRRYFHDDLPEAGGVVSLSAEEAGHAIRVMRIKQGDVICLFDGHGSEAQATIESLGRNDCVCRCEPTVPITRMPTVPMHLAVAFPKPDRAKEMIERLTELGVTKVIPIVADRTQRGPSDALIRKLERVVVEACKQSGRNELMQIDSPVSSHDFFTSPQFTTFQGGPRWIAHPSDETLSLGSFQQPLRTEDTLICAVGPEGGWTDEEVSLAMTSGFATISLGQRIYRIETAAVAVASLAAVAHPIEDK